jgi:hypothetical protein
MTPIDTAAITRFMQGQVAAWNAHDKPSFMALYREFAPLRLEILYAGRSDVNDGWFVIEEMWDKHNPQFRLEVVSTIINGSEAAVHHHNCIVGSAVVIESLETYRFEPGRLSVVYHLKPPAMTAEQLQQFRGFAQTDLRNTPA